MPVIESAAFAQAVRDVFASRRSCAECRSPAPWTPSGSTPAHVPSDEPPWRVLHARKSVRGFQSAIVPGDVVDAIVAAAVARQVRLWDRLDGMIVMHADRRPSAGRGPSMYAITHDGVIVRRTPEAEKLLTQLPSVDGAPSMLLFLTGLEAGACGDGHSYPRMLTLAGSLGYACWLEALRAGYGACLYGRADMAVNEYARRNLNGALHQLTLTLGHPLDDASDSAGN